LWVKDLLRKPMRVAVTSWLQLFIKNTALCKLVRGRIGCDNYNGPKVAKFLVG
jgi:hypothetical protein